MSNVATGVIIVILLWLIYTGDEGRRVRATTVVATPTGTVTPVAPVVPVVPAPNTNFSYTVKVPPATPFPWLFILLMFGLFTALIIFLSFDVDYSQFLATGDVVVRPPTTS